MLLGRAPPGQNAKIREIARRGMHKAEPSEVVPGDCAIAAEVHRDLAADFLGDDHGLGDRVLAEEVNPVGRAARPGYRVTERPVDRILGAALGDIGLLYEPKSLVPAYFSV